MATTDAEVFPRTTRIASADPREITAVFSDLVLISCRKPRARLSRIHVRRARAITFRSRVSRTPSQRDKSRTRFMLYADRQPATEFADYRKIGCNHFRVRNGHANKPVYMHISAIIIAYLVVCNRNLVYVLRTYTETYSNRFVHPGC